MEFFEDHFESHPDQQIQREVHEASGQPYFVTGDALLDKWEREVAEGKEPDYDEPLTPAQRDQEARRLAALRSREASESIDGFEERFDR